MTGVAVTVASPEAFGVVACRELLVLARGFEAPLLGLATGNTPTPLYETLAGRAAAGEISLSRFRPPFAIDEYVVADPGHPCANRAYFARYWDRIATTRPVHQFSSASADLYREAERFGEGLRGAGGLDVVILGIGLNGHLAFNEPGTPRDRETHVAELAEQTRESARACFGDATPTDGLTIGLAEILSARRVLLLARGEQKAAIVARALEGTVSVECPASFLQEHPRCSAVLDSGAAARLERARDRP